MIDKNKPLDEDEILSIISSELARANYSTTDQGYGQLEESMAYYLGRPNGTEVDGRSTVTSTDVADAIEWIMPQIMESFTQVNEIVPTTAFAYDDKVLNVAARTILTLPIGDRGKYKEETTEIITNIMPNFKANELL